MRVTFITAFLGEGHGTAKSARDFLRSLLHTEHSITTISPFQEKFPEVIGGKKIGRPIWKIFQPKIRLPKKFWKITKPYLNQFIYQSKLLSSAHRWLGDVVIVNGYASLEYANPFLKKKNKRYVLIVRESPRHFLNLNTTNDSQKLIEAFNQFENYIFVSDLGRTEWMNNLPLPSEKCFYLPNCIEEEQTEALLAFSKDEIRTKVQYKNDEFVLVYPASVEHRKGQDFLLESYRRFKELPFKIRIVFIGHVSISPKRPFGKQLVDSIVEKSMGDVFTYLPTRTDILDFIYAADGLIFPSRAEALPRTILEAMALKTPVIASAVDGVPELVDDNETGFLFNLDDPDKMINSILKVQSNKDSAKEMAVLGYEKYWNNFSRADQFKRLDSIIENFK